MAKPRPSYDSVVPCVVLSDAINLKGLRYFSSRVSSLHTVTTLTTWSPKILEPLLFHTLNHTYSIVPTWLAPSGVIPGSKHRTHPLILLISRYCAQESALITCRAVAFRSPRLQRKTHTRRSLVTLTTHLRDDVSYQHAARPATLGSTKTSRPYQQRHPCALHYQRTVFVARCCVSVEQ